MIARDAADARLMANTFGTISPRMRMTTNITTNASPTPFSPINPIATDVATLVASTFTMRFPMSIVISSLLGRWRRPATRRPAGERRSSRLTAPRPREKRAASELEKKAEKKIRTASDTRKNQGVSNVAAILTPSILELDSCPLRLLAPWVKGNELAERRVGQIALPELLIAIARF